MTSSVTQGRLRCLADQVGAPDYTARVCEAIERLGAAANAAQCMELLAQTTHILGADAAVFTSFVRDDATLASYRVLLACDPRWATECTNNGWLLEDPWLSHALQSTEPVTGRDLALKTAHQAAMVHAAANIGFRSTVIAPAPSIAGRSRVGVLTLGSATEDFFSGDGLGLFKLLARTMSMTLHAWLHDQIKGELVTQTKLTDSDVQLLRFEEQGLCSKAIAGELGILPKTVDCRFQRLIAKLGAANRRVAVRLARLYGLI
jgi:DNA-binding NarL/FixJ family response regulator